MKVLRLLIGISALLFAAIIGWSVIVLDSVERTIAAAERGKSGDGTVFHFVALLPALERDLFYLRARNGMVETAEEERAAIQVFEYPFGEGSEAIRRLLRLIADISPDGAVLSLPSGVSYDAEIAALSEHGVPVVTLENDLPSSKRRAHVGTNAFELGKLAGKAVSDRFSGQVRVALLLSMGQYGSPSRDATFVMGFRQTERAYPGIRLEAIYSGKNESAAGEEFIRDLLSGSSRIDVAIFTNARDAEGAAQALVEFGRVGTLSIVAFDDTPEIRKLIETGVVTASLARNPEKAGSAAVEALVALARNERTSAYVDPGAYILTRDELVKKHRP
jgi:ribose transport system substrate-binding protein